uniref:Putative fe2+/zn2+ regulated transporter n=1 Tax=Amblyomma sculptum TaxID=1581419 RepID=A0A1E1XNM3_AMBSC
MDTTSMLRTLLLLGGNLIAGPFVYWIHIRADVRQKSPKYHRVALLFSGGILFGVSFVSVLYTGSRTLGQIVPHELPAAEIAVCIGFGVGLCLRQLGLVVSDWATDRASTRRPSRTESTMLSSYSESVDYGATESTRARSDLPPTDKPLPRVDVWVSLAAVSFLSVYYILQCFTLGQIPDQLSETASNGFKATIGNTILVSVALAVVLYSSGPRPTVLLVGSLLFALLPALAFVVGAETQWNVSRFYEGIVYTFSCGVLMCASALGVLCPYSRSASSCCSFPPAAAGIVCTILLGFSLPDVW